MEASTSDQDDQMLPSIDELPSVAASAPAGVTIGANNGGHVRKNSWSDGSVDLTSFHDIFKNGAKDEVPSSDNAELQSPLISRQNYKSRGATENDSFDTISSDANDDGAANGRQQKEGIGQPNGPEKEQANNGDFHDVFNIDSDERASNQATNQQNVQARQPNGNDYEAIYDMGSINNGFDADGIANKPVQQQNPPTRSQEKSEDNQSIDSDSLENEFFNDTNHQEVPIQAARYQLSKNNAPEIQAKNALSARINQSQASADSRVIELLDDDDDDVDYSDTPVVDSNKRQRLDHITGGSQQQTDPAAASAAARDQHISEWMNKRSQPRQSIPRQPIPIQRPKVATMPTMPAAASIQSTHQPSQWHEPSYINLSSDFVPTWEMLFPTDRVKRQEFKSFELSLLNVQEFTITGLAVRYEGPPSSITGLRLKIKEISKPHGKAVFERYKEGDGGKWRIPLVRKQSRNAAILRHFSYTAADWMIFSGRVSFVFLLFKQ
jgi:hypothetical protein